jgi:excisionase family DNA binding protein
LAEQAELLNAEQLARLLQVSEWTVRHKTAAGLIPVVRVGRSLRYEPEVVLAALREPAATP